MSYTLSELQKACREYENKFYGGKTCPGVRSMIKSIIGGEKTTPSKRKIDDDVDDSDDNISDSDFDKTKRTKISDIKINKRADAEIKNFYEQNMLKQQNKNDKANFKNQFEQAQQITNTLASSYMHQFKLINNTEFRCKQAIGRRLAEYKLMHKLGFINFKTKQVARPWSPMIWHLTTWKLVVEDFAFSLVNNVGVTVLLGGGSNFKIDFAEVLYYIMQIRTIINNNQFLPLMLFPMLEALEEKMFLTFLLSNLSSY